MKTLPPATPIAEARDCSSVTVRGTIRRAGGSTRTAPLTQRPCVYFELNAATGNAPPERVDGADFWIEDESGRALVHVVDLEVDARAEQRARNISVIDGDIHEVSTALRKIKKARRMLAGPRARDLDKELHTLKLTATLLCAVRAHARGRVHGGGRSLREQKAYIERESARTGGGQTRRSIALLEDVFEIVLAEGDTIMVSGTCTVEPVPPGLAVSGGYRDMPTCLHLRSARVLGLGAAAPIRRPAKGRLEDDAPSSGSRAGSAVRILLWLAAAGALYHWLTHYL